ncbi:hypothetical protein EIP86_001099 [Pleurotus ostreatoroseus]|nr:hypothetical protein EIP86_001099 [Pleurotus ostreatoroseus]
MAHFQELARVLLSAGGALDPTDKGTHFLYTNNGILTSKQLIGDKWGDQEILAKDVRKDSPAAFLLSDETHFIAYITSSSTLAAIQYDEEDEEWYEVEGLPSHRLHPEGKLAACFLAESEKFYVFFQDPSNRLLCLDSEWSSSTLPAVPRANSPLCSTILDDSVHIFYIADGDHCIHYLLEEDGTWVDNVLATCVLDETLIRFTVGKSDEGILEAYVLTAGKVVLQIVGTADGERRELGKIDESGTFIPGTDAECCLIIPIVVICGWWKVRRRRRRCCCW